MVNYELILTDKCNRNCSFCYVKKTGYIESIENIQKFIDIVKKEQNENSQFEITFFGGEPLLNLDGLKYVIESFVNYKNCKLSLITNGDMIELLHNYEYLSSLHVNLTAYDIFTNKEKYLEINKKINKKVKKLTFQYTFTENDIDLIDEFKDICNDIGVKSKISFSHSIKSWKTIEFNKLYELLYDFYYKELRKYVLQEKFSNIPNTIERYLKRSASLIFDQKIVECNCLTEPKKVFYNGEFIGPCLRYKDNPIDSINEFNRCKECQYKKACMKSCMAECFNLNDIPEKLCIFQKVPFDVIFEYIHSKIQDDETVKMLLKYLLEDMLIKQ